ncbi:MAG: FAD-binding oxidoreductase, partial [Roseococcus sp.]
DAGRGPGRCIAAGWPVIRPVAGETAAWPGTRRYGAAMLDARGGDVQPLSYAGGVGGAAMDRGACTHGGTPAVKLTRREGGWSVQTPAGEVRAAQVVLATNGYTDNLWPGLRRSIVPAFSSIAASAPLPEDVARAIMPRRASVYEIGRITVYYRMDRQNRLVIGGRGPQHPISDTTPIRWITEYAAKLWPAFRQVEWTHGWNGQLGVTPDFYPHLHEPAPGLIAALGYSGRGVAMATAMGGQVARRLLGTAPEALDMPVTSIKPMPFHGFWKLGVMAKVWEGRVLDKLGL